MDGGQNTVLIPMHQDYQMNIYIYIYTATLLPIKGISELLALEDQDKHNKTQIFFTCTYVFIKYDNDYASMINALKLN